MFWGLFVLDLRYGPSKVSKHLSDGPRDLATLTFNLRAHGACQIRAIVLRLCTKFEVRKLPVREI